MLFFFHLIFCFMLISVNTFYNCRGGRHVFLRTSVILGGTKAVTELLMYTSLRVCVVLSEAVLSPSRPVLTIISEVFGFISTQRKVICHDLQPGDWFRLVVSVRTHHNSGTDSRRFPFRCHVSAGGGEQGSSWPVPSGRSCPALLCCPVCATLPAFLLPLQAVPEPAEEPGKVWDSYCHGAGSRSSKERPSPGDVGETLPLKLATEGMSPILALACVSCALGSPGRGSPVLARTGPC